MSLQQKYIEEIADAMISNHAALMVGAGFSKNAQKTGITDASFLNWNELTDLFYNKLYGDSVGPGKNYNSSLRLAQEVEVAFGRPALESLIHIAVPEEEYAPSQLYKELLELNWRDIFTTNYDDEVIKLAGEMFERYPKLCKVVCSKFPYIFVDEYQDTVLICLRD